MEGRGGTNVRVISSLIHTPPLFNHYQPTVGSNGRRDRFCGRHVAVGRRGSRHLSPSLLRHHQRFVPTYGVRRAFEFLVLRFTSPTHLPQPPRFNVGVDDVLAFLTPPPAILTLSTEFEGASVVGPWDYPYTWSFTADFGKGA